MKVDGPCVIVRFPPAPGEEAHGQEEEDMLSRYRALKIEDLVVSCALVAGFKDNISLSFPYSLFSVSCPTAMVLCGSRTIPSASVSHLTIAWLPLVSTSTVLLSSPSVIVRVNYTRELYSCIHLRLIDVFK